MMSLIENRLRLRNQKLFANEAIEVLNNLINYGLKSINVSLSMTPDLSPESLNDLKKWALALNSSLLIIPDTHLISKNHKRFRFIFL